MDETAVRGRHFRSQESGVRSGTISRQAKKPRIRSGASVSTEFCLLSPIPYSATSSAPERPDQRGQPVGVEAEVGEQFVALGVLDEAVGDAEADDVPRVQPGGVGRLEHRRAEAALERPFLDRDDERHVSTACRIVSRSSGLTNRALTTPTSQALGSRSRFGRRAGSSPSSVPQATKHAVGRPTRGPRPGPARSARRLGRSTVSRFAFG